MLPQGLLSRLLSPALGLALLLALGLAGYQAKQAADARALYQAERTAFAEYRETQERQARQALQQLQTDQARANHRRQEALDAEHLARLVAQADADRLRGTDGQLRRYAADLAASLRHPAGDPTTAGGSSSADTAANLLAELSGRLDEAAAGIAIYSAESSRAGQLCERSYDALRN